MVTKMFHKLRLKLTLINAAIIFILFILLITGTYFFSQREVTHRSEMISNKIMSELKSGAKQDLPQRPNETPGPEFFFVKITSDNLITAKSSNIPLRDDKLAKLVNVALTGDTSRGIIKIGNNEYPYLKSFMDSAPETIILFQDFTHEKHMLHTQLTALIITGLICLALSFYGSFFMANRAMAPIQAAWQQQIDFLSDASHELRTPLAIIQTNLEIVMEGQEEPVSRQIKWLQNIQEESTQMAALVDSLLFLARSDAKQQPLEETLFFLNEAILRAALPFEPIAAEKGVTLDVSADTAITAKGDESRIKQVIGILLDNAIRHTEEGGKVSIKLSRLKNKSIVTVADTGEGIAPEEIDKIFDRFYQVDKSRSRGGAGLGLAIAKCIIENHGGQIIADSTLGFGTTFAIQLP